MAQTHICRRFAWQAWDRWYWVARLGRDLAPVTPRHFAWQAWHNLTSTFVSRGRRGTNSQSTVVLRGRRGTYGTGWRPWAGIWRPVTPRHFAWQAWHNLTSTFVSRGRRGTNSHLPSFCVAGVALMVLGGALGPGFGACDAAALCVAGVAQPDIHLRFTWQAWHKLTSTVVFAWQAWHLWYWVAPLGRDLAPVTPRHFAWQAWHNLTSTFVSRGRRGTNSHLPSFCVAGVRLWYWVARLGRDLAPVTPRHFAWQAWHNLTSTFVSRGRRGTKSHLPSFCVAGVALMVLGGALGPGFGACDAAALCVAGVAQPDIHLRFTWQAWHKLTSTVVFAWQAWHNLTSTFVSRGRRGNKLTSTVVLRGRRGTYGTGWRAWAGIWRL